MNTTTKMTFGPTNKFFLATVAYFRGVLSKNCVCCYDSLTYFKVKVCETVSYFIQSSQLALRITSMRHGNSLYL